MKRCTLALVAAIITLQGCASISEAGKSSSRRFNDGIYAATALPAAQISTTPAGVPAPEELKKTLGLSPKDSTDAVVVNNICYTPALCAGILWSCDPWFWDAWLPGPWYYHGYWAWHDPFYWHYGPGWYGPYAPYHPYAPVYPGWHYRRTGNSADAVLGGRHGMGIGAGGFRNGPVSGRSVTAASYTRTATSSAPSRRSFSPSYSNRSSSASSAGTSRRITSAPSRGVSSAPSRSTSSSISPSRSSFSGSGYSGGSRSYSGGSSGGSRSYSGGSSGGSRSYSGGRR